ncbi:MAG: VacJ family lipoprotein [Pseudomonadota bacterium]
MKIINGFNSRQLLLSLAVMGICGLPQASFAQDAPQPAPAPAEEEFFDFDEGEDPEIRIADPLERINRVTFAVNDKLYRGVFKPIARGLRVLPSGVRVSLSNFITNLGAPVSAASALLQADPRNCGTELTRFALNTTAGLFGFFDVATELGIEQDEEDLGQTLARYGVGHGVFLMVPFYGPSSLRDITGSAATSALNPIYQNLDGEEIVAINVIDAEVALSLDQDTYESFYDSALDPYVFFRTAWLQNRAGDVEK